MNFRGERRPGREFLQALAVESALQALVCATVLPALAHDISGRLPEMVFLGG